MRATMGLLVALAWLTTGGVRAACSVASNNGYTVNIDVFPEAIVPSTNPCPNGYNYRVRMRYSISFSGTNIPSSLYTLQGNVTCGSTSIFFDLPNNGGNGTVLSSNAWTPMTNCATTTPNSLGCFAVSIQIEGPSLSSRTIPCAFSPLPIELVGFTAVVAGDAVVLSWSTASESNNDHFTIERSADGERFEAIARIAAAGNSAALIAYETQDPMPLPGISYYRLRQTDTDGTWTVSAIVPVTRGLKEALTIVPNPWSGGPLKVVGQEEGVRLELYGGNGVLLNAQRLDEGDWVIGALPRGLYTARLVSRSGALLGQARLVRE